MRRLTRLCQELARLESELTEARAALAAAMAMAETDPLTGLANRRAIGQAIERAIAGGPVALLLVDLDRFKQINDTYGHQAGDLVLTEVARRLTDALVPGELAARHGGDEFAVLLSDPESVGARAARVHAAITGPVALPDGVTWTVRASVGYAVATDPAELWRVADNAMYRVKAASRIQRVATHMEVSAA